MAEYEKWDGSNPDKEFLDGKKVELEGICSGVVIRSSFFGNHCVYQGFIEAANESLIHFYGSSTLGSTDGDYEASLAKLSFEKNIPATIQGKLKFDHNIGDPVMYSISVSGIKVKNFKSCFYEG